jgi:hypothetical protein
MKQAVSAEFFRIATADAELIFPTSLVRPNDGVDRAAANQHRLHERRDRRLRVQRFVIRRLVIGKDFHHRCVALLFDCPYSQSRKHVELEISDEQPIGGQRAAETEIHTRLLSVPGLKAAE